MPSSDDEVVELDPRVWRRQPPRLKSGCVLPAVSIWTSSVSSLSTLQIAARKTFGSAANTSFWIAPAQRPRTVLERFALDVFWFHVKELGWSKQSIARLGKAAGAEYWVQRRLPSQPLEHRGLNWHFDKDEDLLDETDLTIHPIVGTATYLTSAGAPLAVLTEPTVLLGEEQMPLSCSGRAVDANVVFPVKGRHVAFRGNLLHGIPSALEATKGERISVLVNVWLRHRPLGLTAYPLASRRRAKLPRCFSPRGGRHKPTVFSEADVELPVSLGDVEIAGIRVPRSSEVMGCPTRAAVVRHRPGKVELLRRRSVMKKPAKR